MVSMLPSRCLSVRPFVCPDVCSLTTPTFLDKFLQLWYQWKPHAKREVLRPFENKSMVKEQKYGKNIFFFQLLLIQLAVCPSFSLSVCLSLCLSAKYSHILTNFFSRGINGSLMPRKRF